MTSNPLQVIALESLLEDSVSKRNFDTIQNEWDRTPAHARVFNSANISTTNNVQAALTFNSERWDTGNFHSTSSNTSRLTAPTGGLYSIGASLAFAANATGNRQVDLRITFAAGGTAIIWSRATASAGAVLTTPFEPSTQYHLAAGDYVEVLVFQNSGGALNVTSAANYSPEFWIVRLGSQA